MRQWQVGDEVHYDDSEAFPKDPDVMDGRIIEITEFGTVLFEVTKVYHADMCDGSFWSCEKDSPHLTLVKAASEFNFDAGRSVL
jgi:hypothetical protein